MKVLEFSYKNIISYGNLLQKFEFNDEPQLILVEGENGAGKCLSRNTEVEIDIEDQSVKEEFIKYLKENNCLLKPLSPLNK